MKKYIIFIFIASILFMNIFNINNVKAINEIKYGRAITEDVGFYKDSNGTDLAFYIPYTYYVKILQEGQPYSHIEIYGGNSSIEAIDGYALTSQLYFEDEIPLFPYPNIILKVSNEFSSIYKTKSLNEVERRVFKDRELIYYGHAFDSFGNYIYLVKYNDCLGYIKESDIEPFNFILHPTPLPKTDEPDATSDEPTTKPKDNITQTIKLVIIICVVLAGIIILAVIFKPSTKKDNSNYYDENDYE